MNLHAIRCGFCNRSGAEVGKMIRAEKNICCHECAQTLNQRFKVIEETSAAKLNIFSVRMRELNEILALASEKIGEVRTCPDCGELYQLTAEHFDQIGNGNQLVIALMQLFNSTKKLKNLRLVRSLFLQLTESTAKQAAMIATSWPCAECLDFRGTPTYRAVTRVAFYLAPRTLERHLNL